MSGKTHRKMSERVVPLNGFRMRLEVSGKLMIWARWESVSVAPKRGTCTIRILIRFTACRYRRSARRFAVSPKGIACRMLIHGSLNWALWP